LSAKLNFLFFDGILLMLICKQNVLIISVCLFIFSGCSGGQKISIWGGEGVDRALDVSSDTDGNIYVVGQFQGAADFNPSMGKLFYQTDNDNSAFISKFRSTGAYDWTEIITSSGPSNIIAFSVFFP